MKYRVNIFSNVLGKKYYCVEERGWLFGKWRYVGNSISSGLKEVVARKALLENGHSMYNIFKPIFRVEALNLKIST